jgi:hypothetical protein
MVLQGKHGLGLVLDALGCLVVLFVIGNLKFFCVGCKAVDWKIIIFCGYLHPARGLLL